MKHKSNLLIVSHVAIKNGIPTEGPYSTVLNSLKTDYKEVSQWLLPLFMTNDPIQKLEGKNETQVAYPLVAKKFPPFRYIYEILFLLKHGYNKLRTNKPTIVIACDPLAALPFALLKAIIKFEFIFYSVDFNEARFKHKPLQKAYETADKISSKMADQVWCVCEALVQFKKEHYGVESFYIPNSFPFTKKHFDLTQKSFDKVVWTGSILTNKQIDDILKLFKIMKEMRPELKLWLIPVNKVDVFEKRINKLNIKDTKIFEVVGQKASRQIVSQCDIGLAIYNNKFGSTKYIEPIKIWEYMLCGTPFIISSEVSLNPEFVEKKVGYLLGKDNSVKNKKTLENFTSKKTLKKTQSICIEVAKKYSSKTMMKAAIKKLS